MRRAYICGPMRGHPQLNFPAFFDAEAKLSAAGWIAVNPARLDQECKGRRLRDIVRRDLDAVLSLRKCQGDALVLLPGWEGSVGANAEVRVARWLELPILTLDEATRV